MTTRPPIARRCEDCGLVRASAYRRPCPKCGGWMLTTKKDDNRVQPVLSGFNHNDNRGGGLRVHHP